MANRGNSIGSHPHPAVLFGCPDSKRCANLSSMTNEQAVTIFEYLRPQIVAEALTTRKVLARVPFEKASYSPDGTSMSALKLATHIAGTEKMFLDVALKGQLEEMESYGLADVTSTEGILDYLDTHAGPLSEQLNALTGEQLTKVVKFGPFEMRVLDLLSLHLRHSIHHRGQLSAYLRAMGSTVPAIYGGSGDEPMGQS